MHCDVKHTYELLKNFRCGCDCCLKSKIMILFMFKAILKLKH